MTARQRLPRYAPVPDWCALSGVGRTVTYELIGAGRLKAIKLGSRTLIDVWHGIEMLDALPSAEIRVGRPRKTAASNPFPP